MGLSVALAASPVAADPDNRSAEAIKRVVGGRAGTLRTCYDQAVKRAPKLAGTFVYSIEIAADGHVLKAAAKAPTKASKALDRCVTADLRKLAFGAGVEGAVDYPLVFEPKKPDDVDPALVTLFNEAAELGRNGKNEQALATYRAVIETQRKRKLAAIPRFIATVHLQTSYTLIDLGKLAEAEKELKLVDVGKLGKPMQYSYYFTLGNILGGLGKLKPMFAALVEAISLAEDLDNVPDQQKCWAKILAFTLNANDWAYLKEVSEKALNAARLRGFKELATQATAALEEAKTHLK